MSLLDADRRIAHAANIIGYNVTESGLVVCEQKHINMEYGLELSKMIDIMSNDYPAIFLDLLLAETITVSYANRLALKEHSLAMKRNTKIVLVDPSEKVVSIIDEARRTNGLSPHMRSIFPMNPNPRVRNSQ